ncbi:MAG TPA: hypothetical protein VF487_17755 [Chitinophagaceae bacterium]
MANNLLFLCFINITNRYGNVEALQFFLNAVKLLIFFPVFIAICFCNRSALHNKLHEICGVVTMFLQPASIEELQTLELPALVDMLVTHTGIYTKLLAEEGFSDQLPGCKEVIISIQAAIDAKLNFKKNEDATIPAIIFPESNTTTSAEN